MDAKPLFLLGVRHHQAGDLPKAVTLYREALAADAQLAEASLYLAMALQQLGRFSESETAYRNTAALLPQDTDVLNGLGSVCLELGKTEEAQLAHLKALKLNPTSAEALGGLGNVHLSQGQTDEAIASFRCSLSIAPDAPETLSNLGVALKTVGKTIEAVETLEAALELAPDSVETLYNLGNARQARGDMAKALESHERAIAIDPQAVAPRWGACFAHLDMLYEGETAIDAAREQYARSLTELDGFLTLETPEQIRDAAAAVGTNQPFYLTYQGKNDRELQARYGALVHRIMASAYPRFTSPHFSPRTGKIRVGIATGFMHEHSVWKIPTRGWVRHLDRDRFEVFGYYTGVKEDHCTNEARALFDKLVHEPNRFETLCQTILDDELDALLYPDIGMDPTCAKLAGLRLAPVQCVSLGHPMTTGLPTMDHFLSSDLMEPENGESAYTEQLVRLPNLSVHYEPLRQGEPKYDRAHFGLSNDSLLYFCPQSLYKYLPQYDRLYPLIAKQVPDALFIFLENGRADVLDKRFRDRLSRSFRDHGLDFDAHVVMLPHQEPEGYHALNCISDVFLDSIEWSGFNTAMEAANTGLPIITCPKGHMRGRHSLAVVTILDLPEVVAASIEEYIDLAIRMGTDEDFRLSVRQKTTANRSRLFNDPTAIRGLENFLKKAVR